MKSLDVAMKDALLDGAHHMPSMSRGWEEASGVYDIRTTSLSSMSIPSSEGHWVALEPIA
eukprot:895996-Amphidinium_carterae.1